MKTILITGATGLIGRNLTSSLHQAKYKVIALTTDPIKAEKILKGTRSIKWDDYSILQNESINGIIHLAGMNLSAKRWNSEVKQKLISSRTETAKKLIKLVSLMKEKPEVIVSSSGVDYYGDCGRAQVSEDSPPGDGFLPQLVIEWEKSIYEAEDFGVRVVILRSGFVISKESPALGKMILPFKLFTGGYAGSGKQYFSWIHIDDLIRIYLKAIEDKNMSGSYNAVAPSYETMKSFSKEIGKILSRPAFLPVPKILLKILYGEIADVIISGRKAIPQQLTKLGFDYKYRNLRDALKSVLD